MAHVELSLSQLTEAVRPGKGIDSGSSLDRWGQVVTAAPEPSLLLNDDGIVVAASPGCATILGIDTYSSVGRHLVGDVLHLLDFNAVSGELPAWEIDKIPPLIAITTGTLARGLLRFAAVDGPRTVDAVSVPLRDGHYTAGSLTFFAPVR